MNDTILLKKLNQIYSNRDIIRFQSSDLNTKRLISEHYYDKYESLLNHDRRKTKNFKIAQEIYSEIMQQYERFSN